MTTPTPAGKPLPLTAQATLAHYQREAEHAADLAELKLVKSWYIELIDDTREIHEALGLDKDSPIDTHEILAAIARLKVDAERYRWLRDRHVDAGFVEAKGVKCWPEGSKAYSRLGGFGAELDKQIDAALAASKGA